MSDTNNKVKRTDRGWGGHFIGARNCLFRRNTLLEFFGVRIVVSTVGAWIGMDRDETMPIGHNRYYETMAFHSDPSDERFHDADVSQQVRFSSPWAISERDADDKANDMHEAVVAEITAGLLAGNTHKEQA